MKLAQHPGYSTFTRSTEIGQRCRQAVAAWQASGEPIGVEAYSLCWTFERAQSFVHSLSRLSQEYNRVLWEQFPYCRQCGGQCCPANAACVVPFDSLALALLGQSPPPLLESLQATPRDCIYLTTQGCIWPSTWRPLRCWSFYCLGNGQPPSSERSSLRDAITQELEMVVRAHLPDELRKYELVQDSQLTAGLSDPLDFFITLDNALFEILTVPFNDRYSVIDE